VVSTLTNYASVSTPSLPPKRFVSFQMDIICIPAAITSNPRNHVPWNSWALDLASLASRHPNAYLDEPPAMDSFLRIYIVWIASLFGSTPSNWCLCGSLQRLDQPLVSSVDRRTLWINPLHLWLCGSPNTVDQPLVLSSGSKFPLTLRTIVCLDASGHIVVVSLTKTTVVPTKIPRV